MLFENPYERTVTLKPPCPCGSTTAGVAVGPFGPHYGKRLCMRCGRFCGWEPWPYET